MSDKTKQYGRFLLNLGKEGLNVLQKGIAGLIGGFIGYVISPVWNYLLAPTIAFIRTSIAAVFAISLTTIRNVLGYVLSFSSNIIGKILALSAGGLQLIASLTRQFLGSVAGLGAETFNLLRKALGGLAAILNVLRSLIQIIISYTLAPLISIFLTSIYHLVKTVSYLAAEVLQLARILAAALIATMAVLLTRLGAMIALIGSGLRKVFSFIGGLLISLSVALSRLMGALSAGLYTSIHWFWNQVLARVLSAGLVILNLVRQGLAGIIASAIWLVNLIRTPIAFILAPLIGLLVSAYNSIEFVVSSIVILIRKVLGLIVAAVAEVTNMLQKVFALTIAVVSFILTGLINYVIAPFAGVINVAFYVIKSTVKYLFGLSLDILQGLRIIASVGGAVFSFAARTVVGATVELALSFVKLVVLAIGTVFSCVYGIFGGGWEGFKRFLTSTWEMSFLPKFGDRFTKISGLSAIGEQFNSTFKFLAGDEPFRSSLIATHEKIKIEDGFSKTFDNAYTTFTTEKNALGIAKQNFHLIDSEKPIGSIFTTVQDIGGSLDKIATNYNKLQIVNAGIDATKNSYSVLAGITFNSQLFNSVYQFFGGNTDSAELYDTTLKSISSDKNSSEVFNNVYQSFNPTDDTMLLAQKTYGILAGPTEFTNSFTDFGDTLSLDNLKQSFNSVFEPVGNPQALGSFGALLSWQQTKQDLVSNAQSAMTYAYDDKSFKETFDNTYQTVGGTNTPGSFYKSISETIGGTDNPFELTQSTYQFVDKISDAVSTNIKETIAGKDSMPTQVENTYSLFNSQGFVGFYEELKLNETPQETYNNPNNGFMNHNLIVI